MAINLTIKGIIPKSVEVITGVLPAGLSLTCEPYTDPGNPAVTGLIKLVGTPPDYDEDQIEITARVTAENGKTKDFVLKLTVEAGAIAFVPTSADVTVAENEDLAQQLSQIMGSVPTSVELAPGGTLPAGLAFTFEPGRDGGRYGWLRVDGNVGTGYGFFSGSVIATDYKGRTAQFDLGLTVTEIYRAIDLVPTLPSYETAVGQTVNIDVADVYNGISVETLALNPLPAGLTLSFVAGTKPGDQLYRGKLVISGTPEAAADSEYTLQVKDADGATDSMEFALKVGLAIKADPNPVAFNVTEYDEIDNMLVAIISNQKVETSEWEGGVSSVAGLTFTSVIDPLDETITRVYANGTAGVGTATLTFNVEDKWGNTDALVINVVAVAAQLIVQPETYVLGANVDSPMIPDTFELSNAPYDSFEIVSGETPAGLTMSVSTTGARTAQANISGTPTTEGSGTTVYRFKSTNGTTADLTVTWTISGALVAWAPTNVEIEAEQGVEFSQYVAEVLNEVSTVTVVENPEGLPAGITFRVESLDSSNAPAVQRVWLEGAAEAGTEGVYNFQFRAVVEDREVLCTVTFEIKAAGDFVLVPDEVEITVIAGTDAGQTLSQVEGV